MPSTQHKHTQAASLDEVIGGIKHAPDDHVVPQLHHHPRAFERLYQASERLLGSVHSSSVPLGRHPFAFWATPSEPRAASILHYWRLLELGLLRL